jgi:type VI secretion system protein VasJ
MLDSRKSIDPWHWAAAGKQPVARDFVQVGEFFPLFIALSDWGEKGYGEFTEGSPAPSMHSWRFWARGSRKGHLVCGLLKDSCDNLGRPYPLLMAGTGELPKWEGHWDLLPLACENTWAQMESFSTRRYRDFEEMKNDLPSIRLPSPRWDEFMSKDFGTYSSSPSRELVRDCNPGEALFLRLEAIPSHEQKMQILAWHRLLKNHIKDLPNIVFMGAVDDTFYLFIGRRALLPDDFKSLWDPGRHEKPQQ